MRQEFSNDAIVFAFCWLSAAYHGALAFRVFYSSSEILLESIDFDLPLIEIEHSF